LQTPDSAFPGDSTPSWRVFLTALALAWLALIIRIATCGWGGLSSEECICANIATAPTWSRMLELIKLDGNPPLIYVLIRLWSLAFGGGDLSVRFFAVLAAAAVVPAAYLLFRKQLGEGLSVQLAVLLAACAPLVRFGDLVRSYGLLPLMALLVTCKLMDLLDHPRSRLKQAQYAVLLAATVYLHHWGAVVAIGHWSLVATGTLRRWWHPASTRAWLSGSLTAFILYLPWLLVVSVQLQQDVSPWIARPTLKECLLNTAIEALAGYLEKPTWLFDLVGLVANICLWGSLVIPTVLPGRPGDEPPFRFRAWQIFVAAGLAAATLISQVRPIWRDRYLLAFTPAMLLLYVVCAWRLSGRLPERARWLIPAAIWIAIWIPQLAFFARYPESGAWALVEQISYQSDPARDLVVVPYETLAPQVDRYADPKLRVVSFPDLERLPAVPWAGLNKRIREDARMEQLYEIMSRTLAGRGSVYLVEFLHPANLKPPSGDLAKMDFRAAEILRAQQIRAWLTARAAEAGKPLIAPGREYGVMASLFKSPSP